MYVIVAHDAKSTRLHHVPRHLHVPDEQEGVVGFLEILFV